jgi:hypothetical protein
VVLEKHELTPGAFQQDPSKSNRILINGRLLEEWLGLKVGQSPCCGPCGDAECRTAEGNGKIFETIPADLIVKAGLLAASQMLVNKPETSCCPDQNAPSAGQQCCSIQDR